MVDELVSRRGTLKSSQLGEASPDACLSGICRAGEVGEFHGCVRLRLARLSAADLKGGGRVGDLSELEMDRRVVAMSRR